MALKSREENPPNKKGRSPWFWVPSLYYAEGIPYIVVMTVSVVFYKRMGISNADIALYTSWLYLPWVIKPLWSPIVDIFRTKRFWIVAMQFVVGAAMASIALTIPVPSFFQFTLAFLWLLAFSSATHDIAADGFYMIGLTQHQQAWFVGVRSTFYRFAMLTGQGLLVIFAGFVESNTGLPELEMPIFATQQTKQEMQIVPPDSIKVEQEKGAVHIVTVPDTLRIPMETRDRETVDSLITKIKEWNIAQGQQPERSQQKKAIEKKKGKSLWQQFITEPVGKFIQTVFGEREQDKKKKEVVGNIGVVYLHLSDKPEEDQKVTVNFGRESGDKSIALLVGGRFVFTEKNWNQPAMAVIQLDPKLNYPTRATFFARAGNIPLSWILTFTLMAILFLIFCIYHRFILPQTSEDVARKPESLRSFFKNFVNTFVLFFKKKHMGIAIAFLLIYRLAESQIVKMASPFLLDNQEVGGLALTTGELGFVYGTVGLIMLTVGGLLGGFISARDGLKKWLWPMVTAINLPNIVYVLLAHYQPDSYLIVNASIAIEQFGYGFGFTAYMLYMIYISEGEFKTAHFAITTGFMALGMMLPGMISGWVQELIGYEKFFIWVLICAVPGFIVVKFLPLDPEFGKKKE